MLAEQPATSSGIKWNQVTWYSKLGAIILFIGVVPTLCFYIGTQYQMTLDTPQKPDVIFVPMPSQSFSSSTTQETTIQTAVASSTNKCITLPHPGGGFVCTVCNGKKSCHTIGEQ